MKYKPGFFLADALLALFIFLLGVSAIHRLVQATAHARLNHQLRLKAVSLLEDARAWQPTDAASNWQREFNFQLEPTEQNGFFLLTGEEQIQDQKRILRLSVRYADSSQTRCHLQRQFEYWEAVNAGV